VDGIGHPSPGRDGLIERPGPGPLLSYFRVAARIAEPVQARRPAT
jgi:hypothetical protein